jgi:uncharacterized protein YjdB
MYNRLTRVPFRGRPLTAQTNVDGGSAGHRSLPRFGRAAVALLIPLLFAACEATNDPAGVEPVDLAVHPSSASVEEGDGFQLKLIDPTRPGEQIRTGAGVHWTSSDPDVATVSGGMVHGLAVGETQIRAVTAGGLSSTATVRVVRTPNTVEPSDDLVLEGIVGEDLDQEIRTRVRSVTGRPVANTEVRFDVMSGGGAASPTSAHTDEEGFVQTRWTLGTVAGEQTLRVRVAQRPSASLSLDALAHPGSPETVAVVPGEILLKPGAPHQLTAVLNDRFGNQVAEVPAQWSSADESIARVSESGWVTALEPGRTQIEAEVDAESLTPDLAASFSQAPGNGNGRGRTQVEVEDGSGSDATVEILSGDNQTGEVGETLARDLVVQVLDGAGRPIRQFDVDWTIVEGSGTLQNATSRTDGQGRASNRLTLGTSTGQVRVEAQAGSLGSAAFTAEGRAGSVAQVILSPASASIEAEEELVFAISVRDRYGNVVSDHSPPEWSSRQSSVASVNSNGRARGRSEGTTEVEASVDGVIGSAELAVTSTAEPEPEPEATIASVEVSPESVTLSGLDDTAALNATARDQDGAVMTDVQLEWKSLDTSVAEVDAMGRLSAVAAGSALIVVATVCCDAADTASVRVELIDGEVANPAQVTDLNAISSTEKSVLLSWTEVDDGTGDPARYAVRYASPEMTSWSDAYPTEVSVDGSQIGASVEFEFNGLEQGTEYEFRLVAYRGELNEDATFGELSNSTKTQTNGGSDDGRSGGDDSGSTSDGGSGSAQPLFYDGFESGDYSHSQNGYSWHATAGSPDAVNDGAPVLKGNWAARFRQTTSQQNRLLRLRGPELTEFWFEYWIRVPGPADAPDGEGNEYQHICTGSGNNNKWTEFFSKDRQDLLLAPNTRPNSAGDGGSRIELNTERTESSFTSYGLGTMYNDWIRVPQERSEWVRMGYRVRLGTPGRVDGLFELYKNGVKVFSNGNMDINGWTDAQNHIAHWQIMGWNNCEFPERITWYVDEVRLYDHDPGW